MNNANFPSSHPIQKQSPLQTNTKKKPCLKCLFFPMRLQEIDLLLQDSLAEIEMHSTRGVRVLLRIVNVMREKTQDSWRLVDELCLQGLEGGETLLRKIQQIRVNLDVARERIIRRSIPAAVCLLHCSRCLLTVTRHEWCDLTLENAFHHFLISSSSLIRCENSPASDPFAWKRIQTQVKTTQFDLDTLVLLYNLTTGTLEDEMGGVFQSLNHDLDEISLACFYQHALHFSDCTNRFWQNLIKLYA